MVPRMQLLLVEDDPTMQTTLQRALTRRGMEVTAVGDGKAALSQWVGRVPDAVVLDLTLPGLDGLQVLQRARALGLRTPVLISLFRKFHICIPPANCFFVLYHSLYIVATGRKRADGCLRVLCYA